MKKEKERGQDRTPDGVRVIKDLANYDLRVGLVAKQKNNYFLAHLGDQQTEQAFPSGRLLNIDIPDGYDEPISERNYGPVAEQTARRVLQLGDFLQEVVFITTLVGDRWRCGVVCCLLQSYLEELTLPMNDNNAAEKRPVTWVSLSSIDSEHAENSYYRVLVRNIKSKVKSWQTQSE